VVVLGVGYYFLIKLYREWVGQRREEHVAGGRPQVVVTADYSHLPEIYVAVRNFAGAPAKDVTFDFSAPIEDSDGHVISDLPYFRRGLHFLEPEGGVSCYWDLLSSLAPLLRKKELEDGIRVKTRYKDLAGESYESEWTIDPLLFENARIEQAKNMNDLVNAVESIPSAIARQNGRRKIAESSER
jgi:hypothetical protein